MTVTPLTLLLAILILGFLIAIHEAGHMLVAKWTGMRVLRYSIGFGPVLWKRTVGETTYQIAAIPFGGFVEIDGMNPGEEHEDLDDPRLYENKSVWARTAVIFAGPVTNYAFAFLMAGVVYSACGTAQMNHRTDRPYPLRLAEVTDGKPADQAGLKAGDVITHVDGYRVRHIEAFKDVLARQQAGYRYQPDPEKRKALSRMALTVQRAGKDEDVVVHHQLAPKGDPFAGITFADVPEGGGAKVESVAPAHSDQTGLRQGDVVVRVGDRPIRKAFDLKAQAAMARTGFTWAGRDRWKVTLWIKRGEKRFRREVKPDEQTGLIGVRFETKVVWVDKGLSNNLVNGLSYPLRKSQEMLQGLARLVQFDKEMAASAKGPVGIVEEVQKQLSAGVDNALLIVILLSVLLGLFNLLPIPALDGGRILFRVVEIITRWRISPEREARIHLYGFYVLLALILLLTVRDVRGCGWF